MAERPLLILPEPTQASRGNKGGGGSGPKPLTPGRQKERIGPRLTELEAAFEAKRLVLQTTAAGLVPEDVLVLETAGTIDEFFRAVSRVDGLEFLAEFDEDDIPPDDDFFDEKKSGEREQYRGRVYLMFASQKAFRQLLALWTRWQSGQQMERGLTRWRDVFGLLRDIRPWSARDRLEETGVLDDWRERLEFDQTELPCEVELWYRENAELRARASRHVRSLVQALGGDVLSEAEVGAIHYHALAIRLPLTAVERLLDEDQRGNVSLVQAEQIQFFRASGQMAARVTRDAVVPLSQRLDAPSPEPTIPPVVAMLDGLPLQSHVALADRLSVDDPDDFGADYGARYRIHGTAMASLIIWGDLHRPGPAIPQPLYVRPIMQPFAPPGWDIEPEERVSEAHLIVDLVHRAVRRMFDGDGGERPAAPTVKVVNLSIGIADRPFDGTLSPLARLLDWLSWEYKVLFVVSAGNHAKALDLGAPWSDFSAANDEGLRELVTRRLAADTRNRRLLSPAEGMNVLTVGALHDDHDATSTTRANWVDPAKRGFPSPINAQGQGYKRSVKPEVLAPGGRVALHRPLAGTQTELSHPRVSYGPGQLVATPGAAEGDRTGTMPSRGTSNAAAVVSRAAALLVPVLEEIRAGEAGESMNAVPDSVWLKALLVHGARWGAAGAEYVRLLRTPDNSGRLSEYLTRLLGFGGVDLDAVRECTATRVTALAGGVLSAESANEHRFPLPPSLSGKRGRRRLAVTLAWMTPIRPLNHRWRSAHLWFESPRSKLKTDRFGADWQAAQRGTLQHDVFQGEKAAAFVDGDDVVIRVSCREDASPLSTGVPYALAVTLEVDEAIGIDIYSEIRQRVLPRLRVTPGTHR